MSTVTKLIVEEFNAYDWGGHAKAKEGRDVREAALREEGYQTFVRTSRSLNRDYTGYQIVAFIDEPGLIRPKLPPKETQK